MDSKRALKGIGIFVGLALWLSGWSQSDGEGRMIAQNSSDLRQLDDSDLERILSDAYIVGCGVKAVDDSLAQLRYWDMLKKLEVQDRNELLFIDVPRSLFSFEKDTTDVTTISYPICTWLLDSINKNKDVFGLNVIPIGIGGRELWEIELDKIQYRIQERIDSEEWVRLRAIIEEHKSSNKIIDHEKVKMVKWMGYLSSTDVDLMDLWKELSIVMYNIKVVYHWYILVHKFGNFHWKVKNYETGYKLKIVNETKKDNYHRIYFLGDNYDMIRSRLDGLRTDCSRGWNKHRPLLYEFVSSERISQKVVCCASVNYRVNVRGPGYCGIDYKMAGTRDLSTLELGLYHLGFDDQFVVRESPYFEKMSIEVGTVLFYGNWSKYYELYLFNVGIMNKEY